MESDAKDSGRICAGKKLIMPLVEIVILREETAILGVIPVGTEISQFEAL